MTQLVKSAANFGVEKSTGRLSFSIVQHFLWQFLWRFCSVFLCFPQIWMLWLGVICRPSPGDRSVRVQPSSSVTQLFESRGTKDSNMFRRKPGGTWWDPSLHSDCQKNPSLNRFGWPTCSTCWISIHSSLSLAFRHLAALREILLLVVLCLPFFVTKTIYEVGRCQRFLLVERKDKYCMSSTFWLRLYPFRNLLLVHCLSLVRFLSFPLLPLSLAFFLHFLSLVPFFLMEWIEQGFPYA